MRRQRLERMNLGLDGDQLIGVTNVDALHGTAPAVDRDRKHARHAATDASELLLDHEPARVGIILVDLDLQSAL